MVKIPFFSSRPPAAVLNITSRAFTYRFYLSFCLLVLVLFSFVLGNTAMGIFILAFIQFAFCGDILLLCALKDILHGRTSFCLLVVLCAAAGFLYSAYNTFSSTPFQGPVTDLYVYQMLLITLCLWTERRLVRQREKSRIFVKKVDDFVPKSARVFRQKRFEKVFAGEVKQGDLILVKRGERVPADGMIEKGQTTLEEQLITGNILPALKKPGNLVYAGTLNKEHSIEVRVTEVLSCSALMSVVQTIEKGELRKSDIKSRLDSASLWLILGVFLVAFISYFFSVCVQSAPGANRGILLFVLSLSCPIALPFAVILPSFFMRRGARKKQILIQNPYALEKLTQADLFFFDKTGTLTQGKLLVDGIFPQPGISDVKLLGYLVTAEQFVNGPFAGAVKGIAKKHHLTPQKVTHFEVVSGLGVAVDSGGESVLAGSFRFLKQKNVQNLPDVFPSGTAVVGVAVNKRFCGYITFTDTLREGAAKTVSFLKEHQKEVVLISGDNEQAVKAVAAQVGIARYSFEVLPKTKAEIIDNFRTLGHGVVMTGDGFNDIIALLQADCALVYYSGKNVYNNWVDILIKRSGLTPIISLFAMHRKLRKIVGQNLLLALVLNGLLALYLISRIPAHVPWQVPLGGSLAVIGFVLLNSIRMLRIK